ncbi:HlyD family secretion protein [Anatilimnocola floriformis]|uniref:HlyD family secretion protein n=1 Tax=Anatilimnocola floriformis TaxID=2948575 RepID=UPI0020C59F06|nr:efflux RND transporter periplasmic adaptor subunit [Anatilimnocola floriformis]
MSGGNPAVLTRGEQGSGSTAVDETNLDSGLEARVRSLRLSSIPQGSDWFRSLVLLVVGVGFLGLLYYLVRESLDSSKAAAAAKAALASEDAAPPPEDGKNGGDQGQVATNKPIVASGRASNTAHEAQGYIIPAHQILVSPQVNGRIVELHIEEGRRVEKGAILAKLEDTEYQAEVDRASAAVKACESKSAELDTGNRTEEKKAARAELGESQAQLSQLRTQWERNLELRRTNAVTQQELEEVEAKYRAMEQRVLRLKYVSELMDIGFRQEHKDNAKAMLEQSKAELVKANWRLSNCVIRAPISGTILKKNAEEGNIVNPIAFNGSFSLCDMADLSDLEVDLNVQERDISTIFKGQKCKVRAIAYPERIYDGYVSRLMPIADRGKGAVPVRVKLSIPAEEEGVYLKPEMGVTVTFLKREAASAENKPAAPPATTGL